MQYNEQVLVHTLFVNCVSTLAHCLYIVSVTLHVREDSGLVCPHKIFGAKELYRELSHLVFHPQDVIWNIFGEAHFSRPPSRKSEQLSEMKHSSTSIYLAK